MGVDLRQVFINYASTSVLKINTPYRAKDFDLTLIEPFDFANPIPKGHVIDLETLKKLDADEEIPPPLFAFVSLTDATDPFRGKIVCVAAMTSKTNYKLLGQLNLGEARPFSVRVVV